MPCQILLVTFIPVSFSLLHCYSDSPINPICTLMVPLNPTEWISVAISAAKTLAMAGVNTIVFNVECGSGEAPKRENKEQLSS